MFLNVLVDIIVKYVGPDVFDTQVINLNWPRNIFFQMQLTCLSDIIDHLNITRDELDLKYECARVTMDGSETIEPSTDVIYQLYHMKMTNYELSKLIHMNYLLSKYTALPTSEYIKRYPKAVNFNGLCESKYVE